MRDAVIVSATRTAVARAITGSFRKTRPEHTATEVVKEAIRRTKGLKPEEIDDLVAGWGELSPLRRGYLTKCQG
jgi:acetyl-CoA acyltransferase